MGLGHRVADRVVRDRDARDEDHAVPVLRPHQASRIDRDRIRRREVGGEQLTLGWVGHP
jgi:hypothetical protein